MDLITYRYFLTLLIWALILELIVFIYYIPGKRFGVEFVVTFIMFLITVLGIFLIVRKAKREIG
uniref:Uncharacterized protein n=1 Tax=Ignisphaera aggregans TaxID=334771 RepID=A0A7C5TEV4_9CREN